MADFNVNHITGKQGQQGTVLAGVTTVSSTGSMRIPSGPTEQRGGRGRAISAGGNSYTSVMEYISVPSTGNGTDFGDLNEALNRPHGCSSSTRGVYAGGQKTPGVQIGTIQYTTMSSSGGVADFGDLTADVSSGDAASNNTRGIISAGYDAPINIATISSVEIASTGNATDFGKGLYNRGQQTVSSTTRYVSAGGYGGPVADSGSYIYLNVIDYLTFSTRGNPVDYGDLTISAYGASGGTSSSTRGIFSNLSVAPGTKTNTINYSTIATTGNAIDFGDMTVAKAGTGAGNSIRGVFMGGGTNPADGAGNTIDYITISTTGNATDFGDLITAVKYAASLCDSHGGIGD